MWTALAYLTCILALASAKGGPGGHRRKLIGKFRMPLQIIILGKCDDGSKPTCADGSEPIRVRGQPPCPEGRPKCADGSPPSRGSGGGFGHRSKANTRMSLTLNI